MDNDVRTMPAGREMDSWVAEKVMGWTAIPMTMEGVGELGFNIWRVGDAQCRGLAPFTEFEPSTDIADAWEVVEKMAQKYPVRCDFDYGVTPEESWICVFGDAGGWIGLADTMPLAICRAALQFAEKRSHA